ncbi:hypothetical protein [Flavobacterium psychrotrophum]|uniref:hypothetical protein n=1 Tax=Flavobacterium psychrotrophum TaxID=2294119 RepID=UPI0013C49D69|nr:hypothetical protein [Flavobacterium psychrotrophum]
MKNFLIALLFLSTGFIYAQTPQQKVWDLLLQNKRIEARRLFDKDLKKRKIPVQNC